MKRSHNVLFSLLYLALLFGIGISSSISSKKHHLCDEGDSLLLLQFIKHFEIHQTDPPFLCNGHLSYKMLKSIPLMSPTPPSISRRCDYNIHNRALPSFCKQSSRRVTRKELSWDESSDCCKWEGVTCDTSTGHVIGLDLYCRGLKGPIHRNSTLFQLQHLQKLNLAFNDFSFNPLPNEIGNLTGLTHLNLSISLLPGGIPFEISHLSKLVSLDLSTNFDRNVSSLLFLQNLTKLEVLSLYGNGILCTIPWNISASLRYLDLSENNIFGSIPDSTFQLSASLRYLDLSENNIVGSIPDSIFQLSELESLDLGMNVDLVSSLPKFSWRSNHTLKLLDLRSTGIFGELPNSIGNLKSLNYFYLSECRFFGVIPASIGNLTHLKVLSLNFNEFNGSVPFTISNLNQLTTLDLSNNHFQGEIPNAFSNLHEVTFLGLYGNNFTGVFPSSIVNMTLLEDLDLEGYSLIGSLPSVASGLQNLKTLSLSRNALNGKIPPWIFSIPSLTQLDLSQNQFMGQLPEISSKSLKFATLSHNRLDGQIPPTFFKLEVLDLSFNLFSWSNDWRMPEVNISDFPIRDLRLSSCEIRKFPDFIRNLTSLVSLDLSNNKLEGQIPNWFASVYWRNMYSLDLSQNHLIGGINQLWIPLLGYLDLHSNQLQGPLTFNICNSSQLQFLNLRYNKFNGTIPDCLGELYDLSVLDLAMNNFNGISPTMFAKGNNLTIIALNGNQLRGSIPRSLVNCAQLEIFDLGNNKLNDTFPKWLADLQELQVLILSSNKLYGPITLSDSKIWFPKLRVFDLSCNSFSGILPKYFFNYFKAMINVDESEKVPSYLETIMGASYNISINLVIKGQDIQLERVLTILTTIDLSSNQIEGEISMFIGNLNSLRLLNLSHNCFNGSIPHQLGDIKLLESLDISWNQLTGKIPEQLTNLTFLEVLNLSQNHLVGPIPTGKQFNTFENDSYGGNLNLCGFPLSKGCNGNGRSLEPRQYVEQEEKSDFLSGFTWKAVVIGFGCGLVFGILIENLMSRIGKSEWFVNFYGGNKRRSVSRPRRYGRRH